MVSPLLDRHDLATRLATEDPPPVLLDVRWTLGGPPGQGEFRVSHIPTAQFVDLERELSAAPGPGRHPLPEPAAFEAAMRQHGVTSSRPIVVYDAATGTSAARAWWLLRYFGHPDVALLDGGFARWKAADLPLAVGDEPDRLRATSARGRVGCHSSTQWARCRSPIAARLSTPGHRSDTGVRSNPSIRSRVTYRVRATFQPSVCSTQTTPSFRHPSCVTGSRGSGYVPVSRSACTAAPGWSRRKRSSPWRSPVSTQRCTPGHGASGSPTRRGPSRRAADHTTRGRRSPERRPPRMCHIQPSPGMRRTALACQTESTSPRQSL